MTSGNDHLALVSKTILGSTGNQLRSQRPSQTARPEGHPVTSGNDRLTLVSQAIQGNTGNQLRSQRPSQTVRPGEHLVTSGNDQSFRNQLVLSPVNTNTAFNTNAINGNRIWTASPTRSLIHVKRNKHVCFEIIKDIVCSTM